MAGGASLAPRRWSFAASATPARRRSAWTLTAADDGRQEGQELRVVVRVVAGVEKVLAVVGAHRPVVVLARAVDAREGLLVGQEHKVVLARDPPHHAQHDHVVVGADRRGLVHRGHLELRRCHLVVARLGRDAQPPQLTVEIHHEGQHSLADRAEVLVLELLALRRGGAEERASREDEVRTLLGQAAIDEEVLLLGADVGEDAAGGRVAEPLQDAQGLLAQRLLRAQHRDLVIERLARVRDEGGRDGQGHAVRLDLQEDRAGDVPGRIAAGLEGRSDAARRERAGVRLALDQALARELGDGLALTGRVQERVVLLGAAAGHRHEPVGVVGGAVRHGPLLDAVGYRVGYGRVEGLEARDGAAEPLEDRLGQVLALDCLMEHVLAVDVFTGVLEVVLGGGNLVARDCLDRLLTSGHGDSYRLRSNGVASSQIPHSSGTGTSSKGRERSYRTEWVEAKVSAPPERK